MNLLSLSTLAILILLTCITLLELTNARSYREVSAAGSSRPERVKLRKKDVSYRPKPAYLPRSRSNSKSKSKSERVKSRKKKEKQPRSSASRDRERDEMARSLWPGGHEFIQSMIQSELEKLREHHVQNYDKLMSQTRSDKDSEKKKKRPAIVSLSMRRTGKKGKSDNIVVLKNKVEDGAERYLVGDMDSPLELEVSVNKPSQNKMDASSRLISQTHVGGIIVRNVNKNGLSEGDTLSLSSS